MNLIFAILAVLYVLFITVNEAAYLKGYRREISYLSALDEFLSGVRHKYYYCGNVADAVYYSSLSVNSVIRRDIYMVREILDAPQENVNTICHPDNKYMRRFLAIALLITENGDRKEEGGSVFTMAVMQLKNDILEEKRKLAERKHRFAGLSLTAAVPVIAVPFIARWGSSTIPTLTKFYYGARGNCIKLCLMGISLAAYLMVSALRTEGTDIAGPLTFFRRKVRELSAEPGLREYRGKIVILLRKEVLMILAPVILVPLLICGHRTTRNLLVNDVSDLENVFTYIDGNELRSLESIIPMLVQKYTSAVNINPDKLTSEVYSLSGVRQIETAQAAAEEIMRRTAAWKAERFGFEDLIITILFAFLMYMLPDMVAWFERKLQSNRGRDEILQFQSLIHMQKNVPGISPLTILESMEEFATVYKEDLRRCINDYSVNDIEALKRLMKESRDKELCKLAECFMAVDEAGVEAAFEEISDEIVNFRENIRQSFAIRLDEDAALGSLLAVLPGGIILFGYLLLPFMLKSLAMFNSYQELLHGYIA